MQNEHNYLNMKYLESERGGCFNSSEKLLTLHLLKIHVRPARLVRIPM